MAIATINPATGETLKSYEPLTDDALEEKIARAAGAVAELMVTEMGKTLAAAKAEVAKCALALRWYAEHGPALLEPERKDADAVKATEAYVVHQPIGVVLAI